MWADNTDSEKLAKIRAGERKRILYKICQKIRAKSISKPSRNHHIIFVTLKKRSHFHTRDLFLDLDHSDGESGIIILLAEKKKEMQRFEELRHSYDPDSWQEILERDDERQKLMENQKSGVG